MALASDVLIDRRRLKRRLLVWRLVAFAGLVALAAVLWPVDFFNPQHVAKIRIEGLIFSDSKRIETIDRLIENDDVHAVVLSVNSPGGTFVGGERLYRALRRLAEHKPLVAVMDETATSAAYMVCLAAEHIIASPGTITGSVGVIMQTADLTGFLEKLGVRPETVKSGPLKAQPNPLEPFSGPARKVAEQVIADLYGEFSSLVRMHRGKSAKDLALDGRIVTGREAFALGMIDGIGDEAGARAWLETRHDIPAYLPIQAYSGNRQEPFFSKYFEKLMGKIPFSEWLALDGVIAVWHPDL